jgi:hypothetical protein
MTTFKEAQKELAVVESVEGEYLTADEYYHARINQLRDEEMCQRFQIELIKARQKHQSQLQSAFVSFPRWWQ